MYPVATATTKSPAKTGGMSSFGKPNTAVTMTASPMRLSLPSPTFSNRAPKAERK